MTSASRKARPKIGVLALQGAFAEHCAMLRSCGADAVEVRSLKDMKDIQGMVLPGGESTVMGKLLVEEKMLEPVRNFCLSGAPVLATCAGLILLGGKIPEYESQPTLSVLEITVRRNAFGRQKESFAAEISMLPPDGTAQCRFPGVFIRAPVIEKVSEKVQVLASIGEKPVAVRQGNIVGCAFHPELTDNTLFHRWMLGCIG